MGVFERVKISLLRNLGKSMILFLLVLIIGTVMTGAIVVNQTVNDTEDLLFARIPPIATTEFLWREAGMGEWDVTTRQMIVEIGNLPYVRSFSYRSDTFNTFSRYLHHVDFPLEDSNIPTGVDVNEIIDRNYHENNAVLRQFQLSSVDHVDIPTFKGELLTLTSGRSFTQSELENGTSVALVSEAFATLNNLEIGDYLPLENVLPDWKSIQQQYEKSYGSMWMMQNNLQSLLHLPEFQVGSQDMSVEVIGIFSVNFIPAYSDVTTFWDAYNMHRRLQNKIYIPGALNDDITAFINELHIENGVDPEFIMDSTDINLPVFLLHDLRDFPYFLQASHEILPDTWTVQTLSDIDVSVRAALVNLEEMAQSGLLIATFASSVILGLTMLLLLRERKKEIGIYLALGEKKSSITRLILLEISVISVLSLTTALFIGSSLSQVASRQLVSNTVTNLRDDLPPYMRDFDIPLEIEIFNPGRLTSEELSEYIHSGLNTRDVIFSFGLSSFVIFISVVIPVYATMKTNPKSLLQES